MISPRITGYLRSLVPGTLVAFALLSLAGLMFYQLTTLPQFSALSLGPRFIKTLGWSSLQAGLSTAFSLALGCLIAWALSHQRSFPGRRLLIALLSSAMVLPTLVVVLGLVSVLGRNGWANQLLQQVITFDTSSWLYGLDGILIAHVYFNASFAARVLLTRFESIPSEQHKLSHELGLNPLQRFKLIEWPTIAGAVPGLATTIFLLCFTSFAIVLILGGSPKYNTLEVAIYEAIKLDFNLGRALGLALIQLAICATLVAFSTLSRSLDQSIAATDPAHKRRFTPLRDKPATRAVQLAVITLTGSLFVLPLAAVIFDGWRADLWTLLTDSSFIRATVTSISIALLSTTIVLLCSIALMSCYTTVVVQHRLGRRRFAQWLSRFISFSATLYLAVPALVLGLGFFLVALKFGGVNSCWAGAALITANVLMVLPFALVTLTPAASKAAYKYDKLAFSLGVDGYARWRLIEFPLLRQELIYVASIAFCMSLGDLGVIALFGNQDFFTLPWLLYQKMGAYRTTEAAGIALFMLTITLTVFLLLPALLRGRDADSQ